MSSYLNIAQLALKSGPVRGGIALAAVLAAVISSGAPILLASATMFVNDWIPGSKNFSSHKKLRAYKLATVIYGLIAALIAWLGNISSVLGLVLLGFAMVVPPAVAGGFVLYWKQTSEKAAFWGMAFGFFGGSIFWLLNSLFGAAKNATAGGFAQWWFELITFLGAWRDPSFVTFLVPNIIIPIFTFLFPNTKKEDQNFESFYLKLGRIQKDFSWK